MPTIARILIMLTTRQVVVEHRLVAVVVIVVVATASSMGAIVGTPVGAVVRTFIGAIVDAIVGARVGTASSCAVATAAPLCRGMYRYLGNRTAMLRRLMYTHLFVELSLEWFILALLSSDSLHIHLVTRLVREVYTPRIATCTQLH